VAVWGHAGDDGLTFRSPNGIAIDSSDNVYVTEFRGDRVRKFTPGGKFLDKLENIGSGPGRVGVPTSISLDSAGNMYISNFGSNRVQQFSAGSEFLNLVGRDTLAGPHGAAFDSTGAFYVADTGNNVVRKFQVAENP